MALDVYLHSIVPELYYEGIHLPEEPADQISEEGTAFERQQTTVEVDGRRFEVNVLLTDSKTRPPRRSTSGLSSSSSGSGQVVAPMQGTIVNVLVEKGAESETGNPICVLEAMKMQQTLKADWSGVVKKVHVKSGDQVLDGDPILELE